MFCQQTPIDNINIAILGCVSAGKSTILNAMFCQDFSESKIKRTTMMPTAFVETKNKHESLTPEEISFLISEKNKEIIVSTEKGGALDLKDHGIEQVYKVDKLDIKISKNYNVTIYDTPGLNDARTKNHYYKYLEDNFEKFNIVMFIVDINSGLNTSDEMDIINFIANNILKVKNKFNKDIKLLVVVNKSDEIQLNEATGKVDIVDEELLEMFKQTEYTVVQTFASKNIPANSIVGIIPICGVDAHLYRMIRANGKDYKLSASQKSRIGIREEGNKFRKMTESNQEKVIQKIISNKDTVNDAIKLSGFERIDLLLAGCISKDSHTFVSSNIAQAFDKTDTMTLDHLLPVLIQQLTLLAKIKNTDKKLYEQNMKLIIKKIHQLIKNKTDQCSSPNQLIQTYDDVIRSINDETTIINIPRVSFFGESTDTTISEMLSFFWNLKLYPDYVLGKLESLITSDFSKITIPIKKLRNFLFLEKVGLFNKPIIEKYLDMLMIQGCGLYDKLLYDKFNFNDETEKICKEIIVIFDKLSCASNFVKFLRSFLMCRFNSTRVNGNEILLKSMLYFKYGEIPLYNYLMRLSITKNITDVSLYCYGLDDQKYIEDIGYIFDSYYLEYAKTTDPLNFRK
jgi:small GTP-binding protein